MNTKCVHISTPLPTHTHMLSVANNEEIYCSRYTLEMENFLSTLCSCQFLFLYFLKKSGIVKLTEWSMIPACPSLICFFNRGDIKGTNSSQILCSMFVYVLFYVNLCQDRFCGFWIICGLVFVCRVNRRQTEHCF